jgi:hypothetical protein
MHTSFTRMLGITALAIVVAAYVPAHAALTQYNVTLDGPSESPPNISPGTGTGFVQIDPVAHTMRVNVTFGGLIGNTTASHIHSPTAVAFTGTAGVATQVPTFIGFPLGVTFGSYDQTFDMTLASSYNPAYMAAHGGTPATAEADLFASFAAGKAYLNIHSNAYPGGEIRGFLKPAPVPTAPTTWGSIKALYR